MALSAAQKAENRKDFAAGKAPRNKTETLILPADVNTIDTTYGVEEATAITSNRTFVDQAVDALIDIDLFPPRV